MLPPGERRQSETSSATPRSSEQAQLDAGGDEGRSSRSCGAEMARRYSSSRAASTRIPACGSEAVDRRLGVARLEHPFRREHDDGLGRDTRPTQVRRPSSP